MLVSTLKCLVDIDRFSQKKKGPHFEDGCPLTNNAGQGCAISQWFNVHDCACFRDVTEAAKCGEQSLSP